MVMQRWAKDDAGAAGSWLEGAPAGPARDEGYVGLVRHWLAELDMRAAWAQAQKVEDYSRRVRAAKEVYAMWVERDSQAAMQEWLKEFPNVHSDTLGREPEGKDK